MPDISRRIYKRKFKAGLERQVKNSAQIMPSLSLFYGHVGDESVLVLPYPHQALSRPPLP